MRVSSVSHCVPRGQKLLRFVTKRYPARSHPNPRELDKDEEMTSPSIVPSLPVNKVSGAVVSSALKVHSILGPGLLESAYDACLSHELRNRGFHVDRQIGLPVIYEGEKLDLGYRLDLLVEGLVIVEVKCVDALHPVHEAQLLSYLRLSKKNVGLLINFHAAHLKDGIKRMVDGWNWERGEKTS